MTLDRNTLLEAAKVCERVAEQEEYEEEQLGAMACAHELRALAAAQPEGWVLVPREPTKEMQDAMLECIKEGMAINDDAHRSIRHGYRAMLAAAGGKS